MTNFRTNFFCDLCDVEMAREAVDSEVLYSILKTPIGPPDSFEDRHGKGNKRMLQTEIATPLQLARIEPWAGLDHQPLIVETPNLGDLDVGRLMRRVERYGISVLRMTAQSADDHVLTSLAKLLGPPCEEQNKYRGTIKRIRPEPDGLRNSGDTVADLGLHVDGTQHSIQPALLAFQYVAEAKVGANSIFVDAARVLHDIDSRKRHQLVVSLSRQDAATFSKRGMDYSGPIFSLSAAASIIARLRFDEVIKLHPDCLEDYQELKRRFNFAEYQLVFKPREGDVILFDNWRLLHARDEVFGLRQREHNRMWIANLFANLQPQWLLGIRGLPIETSAAIKVVNEGR
ncbi:MAG TPA: TauD/TfdA family dioxygenase [Pyrinomonadaceae bacterium]|nr:TauD/TfdA family dioxygenase [Pyrinomonadaceae bacterium]